MMSSLPPIGSLWFNTRAWSLMIMSAGSRYLEHSIELKSNEKFIVLAWHDHKLCEIFIASGQRCLASYYRFLDDEYNGLAAFKRIA